MNTWKVKNSKSLPIDFGCKRSKDRESTRQMTLNWMDVFVEEKPRADRGQGVNVEQRLQFISTGKKPGNRARWWIQTRWHSDEMTHLTVTNDNIQQISLFFFLDTVLWDLTSSLWSSCLSPLNAEIRGVCHQAPYVLHYKKYKLILLDVLRRSGRFFCFLVMCDLRNRRTYGTKSKSLIQW